MSKFQAGDRVRVTVEGVVDTIGHDGQAIKLDGGKSTTAFTASELAHATVEVIDRPLAVGDKVLVNDGDSEVEIVFIKGDEAVLAWTEGLTVANLEDLTRAA